MKNWYLSKTLWFNAVAGLALLLQNRYGFLIAPEAQSGILALINIILRVITKAPLDWTRPQAPESGPDAGYIRMPAVWFLCVAFAAIVALTGCATTNSNTPSSGETPLQIAGKSLLTVKSTIVVAATSADTLCKNGALSVDKCTQAKRAYETVKPAYDATVDAYLLMSSQGGDPAAFGAALIRVQSLAANFLLISGGAN